MPVSELVIKTALSESVKFCVKYLKEKRLKVSSTNIDVETAIAQHLNQINLWSREINFKDLKKSKTITDVFIDIDISLMPRKQRLEYTENIEKIDCKELFNEITTHCVILGQPGAGKTTLMKFLCQSIMLDENFYTTQFKIPIIIRLRELNNRTGEHSVLINYLFDLLGLVIEKVNLKEDIIYREEDISLAKERLVFHFLEGLKPLIILDGFDELSTPKLKNKVMEEFKKIILNLQSGRVALTSRSSDYNYSIENTKVLEICPLNTEQINEFTKKWLVDETKVEDFIKSLNESPFSDTSIRPLTLSHLCAIYERIGRIPEKPKTVYRKIINLLLEEWDEQREIKRNSEYGSFEIDRKFEFLCRIAYEITIQYKQSIFSVEQLKSIYHKICVDFSLPKNECTKVIREIESHSGLIIQSGYMNYEFAHKSIHEFLCGEHLVKLPFIINNYNQLKFLPNELAIATTISSDSSWYFCELVVNRLHALQSPHKKNIFGTGFISAFVNRIVLEKPDFNSSQYTSFALVVLYTLFIKNDYGQLELFNTELPAQFEKFVTLIFQRNKKFDFRKFYDINTTYKSPIDSDIIKLDIRRQRESDRYIGFELPKYLLAKKIFISGFE